MMARIAEETEQHLPYEEWRHTRTRHAEHDVADTVSYAAVVGRVPARPGGAGGADAQRPHAAARVGAPAARPRARPVGAARDGAAGEPAVRRARPPSTTSRRPSTSCWLELRERARELGFAKSGDLIGITAGLAGQGLGTNLLEVHRVP